jgi:hypothetical protein
MLVHAALALAMLPVATPDPLGARLESATLPVAGTPVAVHYTAFCSPAAGNFYTLRVTVAQRTGRTVATGHAEASDTCTGRRQSLMLWAVPDTPLRPGRMSVTSCLRVHNARPSVANLGVDAPPCTTEPRTTVVENRRAGAQPVDHAPA